MTAIASALELSCFAYLALPGRIGKRPRLISTYPTEWTAHYMRSRYELIDPGHHSSPSDGRTVSMGNRHSVESELYRPTTAS
ncbi:MAG: autoinducer binding domain-containing protein [Bradyrhizobium sp.]